MYRIYQMYKGRKYYDCDLYTEREARKEMRLLNRETKKFNAAAYFLERV